MNPSTQGKREIAESVVTAALVAVATEAVTWLFQRLKRRFDQEQTIE